ncbi:MAG: MFS transporter [Bdellovibrionales bacterium]|nr:MFS transporter [Bdellovibrionales bacterium]
MNAPTVRYGGFYALFYAFLVAPLSFLPLYFNDLGFSAAEIGLISIIGNIAVILGAPFSLHLIHFVRSRSALRKALVLAAGAAFSVLFFFQGVVSCSVFVGVALFFHKAVGSLIDAAAVRASAEKHLSFDHARLGGSLGFVAALYLFGFLVDNGGSEWSVVLGALSLLALAGYTFLFFGREGSAWVDEPRPSASSSLESDPGSWINPFTWLCIALALAWGSSSVMVVYLSVYLEALGWNATEISHAWAVSVLAEILAFLLFARLWQSCSLLTIFRVSILLTTCRWVLMASTTDFWGILLAQLFHAFSFATLYLSSTKLVFEILPDNLRDKGQGWIVMLGSGLGALLGKFAASYGASRLDSLLELPFLFNCCAFVAFAGYLISIFIRDGGDMMRR